MNLLRTLATVSSMTMVSRILGFVRDTIIARVFGAGMATDAFFVAFKLPNLLRRIFAEGAFAQAFVPIFSEYKQTKSQEATRAFLAHVAGLLSLILVLVTALGMLAAPWVLYVSAPGFATDADKFELATQMLRITFPYILLISLSSLVGSVLNAYSKFSIPAFTPTFLNISFIVFALFLTPYFDPPVLALAWAVFFGGILQLCFQLPALHRLGFLVFPRLSFKDPAVFRVLKQMGPAILGVSVAQISLVINTIFASFLVSGSVSWMYYADRLMELPTGVLGVALGTILLPTLSRHAANKSTEQFSELLDWGIRLSLLLALPAAVGLAVLSFPLVATLFMYNQFTLHDATMTQYALVAYAFGLVGLILVKVLAPGFYARQNIKTPVKVAMFTLFMTQVMNLIFIWKLQHVGLALAIGLGACLNAGILWFLLVKHGIYQPKKGWFAFLFKISIALILMGGTVWASNHYLALDWQIGGGMRVLQLSALIGLAVVVYFGSLILMGFRPRHFKRTEAN
ncbi:MAG: murein biosynthesis integral membrane protein MurJ [Neisseriaceae bacterium]|nr:murein biosynthesis integral membrane protein MurJ [Neisseriaceae bacterium]MBP6862129.1 murein biosynthesis integral membrane protein MurJ [Neisseriaceae bacterium]